MSGANKNILNIRMRHLAELLEKIEDDCLDVDHLRKTRDALAGLDTSLLYFVNRALTVRWLKSDRTTEFEYEGRRK